MAGQRPALSDAIEAAQAGPDTSTALATTRPTRSRPLAQALEAQRGDIRRALPDKFPGGPERFTRLVLTAVRLVPDLERCTPLSVVGAAMQAAQLGLEPGVLGQAWILPYRNRDTGQTEASFQLGWRGLVVLAGRSGFLLSGATVRAGDAFDYELGVDTRLSHRPDPYAADADGDLWWALARDRDTGRVVNIAVLNRAQVERRRKASKSPNSPAWTQWYNEMALGKAAREVVRMLPLSVEMGAAIASDGVVRTELEGRPDDYVAGDEVLDVESEETPASA